MAPDPRPTIGPRVERGAGTELWLLRAGSEADLEARLRSFAGTPFALVLSAPGEGEEVWAAAFARANGAALERSPQLRPPSSAEPAAALAERAWPVLERALSVGHARVLAVLPGIVLRVVVARALGLPLERPASLRVDPGRAVLLRDDPIGLVLRRSNVLAPEADSGTTLPGGTREDER